MFSRLEEGQVQNTVCSGGPGGSHTRICREIGLAESHEPCNGYVRYCVPYHSDLAPACPSYICCMDCWHKVRNK